MPYPSLVWTVLGIVGAFLLLDEVKLSKRNKWGVSLIFIGFMFQVYWEITHPWMEITSLVQVIFVTIYLLIALPLLIWPGWLRKQIHSKEKRKIKP